MTPRVIAGSAEDKFRIVRLEDGNHVEYVVEMPDKQDAMGAFRWRDVASAPIVAAMRDYIIRHQLQQETANAEG